MLQRLVLDARGIREFLGGPEVRAMVDGVAEDVRARVRAKLPPGTLVRTRKYTTDRGAASVTIADVRGMGWQARDGVLTRAAGELGIEVRDWRAGR
ncbi:MULTISPECIES: hypothetical protein [Streptomyces]|uniref:Uncharacterized protein n=1 Tax=Streptomyces fradiae ATCC 10745 = DSM 40063 TaxID=1319510 RepID=A0A1Y2NWB9_STRFR|nr:MULTISPECIES: hypothetical protein [Streptomyces]KAF0649206.1 hypothetical protein K701_13945 [Streptomyces fradiae ATCC 10745 = DSM 40063]OSY51833.1 hypothetical protein BG846_02507 [Streptomyces fradiae ATCC 10745 = DSM 40063]QEV12019.1 hypothetical protein CP974_08310 [Streptomyces fradiae ATCC 10745 = DSM 40063]